MNEEARFLQGIGEFNREEFFECHDTLEALWMETAGRERVFLQGLIQVSVGFYHFFNGNFKGAASQLTKGLSKLDGYRPVHHGIDLENFMRQTASWLSLAKNELAGTAVESNNLIIPKLAAVEGEKQWQQ